MPDSLDATFPIGGGDEFIARCEILPGAGGCSYSITGGGAAVTGGLSGGQPPTPEPGVVAHVLPATLNVVVREGIRVSSGDARRQGPNAPAHVRTREESGAPWVNIFGVTGSGDGAQASRILSGTPGTQIVAQDFGFRIPLSAAVTGISVEIDRDVFGGIIDSESTSLVLCGASSGGTAIAGVLAVNPGFPSGMQRIDNNGAVVQAYAYTDNIFCIDSAGFAYSVEQVGANAIIRRAPIGDPLSGEAWTADLSASSTNFQAPNRIALDNDDRLFAAVNRAAATRAMDVYRLSQSDGSVVWNTPVTIPSLPSDSDEALLSIYANGGIVVVTTQSGLEYFAHVILDAETGAVLDTLLTDISLSNPMIETGVDADGNIYAVGEVYGEGPSARRIWPTTLMLGAVDFSESGVYVIKVDAATNSAYVGGSGIGYSRYLLDGGGLSWSAAYFEYTDLVVGRAGEVFVYKPDTSKVVRLDPTTKAEMWTADAIANGLVPHPPLSSVVITPLAALFDEGYETSGGSYACTLSPLTPTGVGAHRLSASLDDVAGWLPADVNNISFGVVYAASGSGVVRVDAIRVYVDYAAQFSDALEGKRPNGLAGVAVAPSGRRVAVGVAGKALYSDDGVTWTEAVTPTVATLLDVTWDYKLGRFVAVGRGVVIAGDGATWARVDALIPETLWEVRSDRKTRALAAMGEGGVSASPDTLGNWLTRYT